MKTPLLLSGLLLSASLFAQGDIQLTHFTADYTEITGGETYPDENWDDPEIDIPLDFSFSFGGSEITNLIQLGYGAEWGSISAAGVDFIAYGGDVISSSLADEPGAPSSISWVTEGNPGNRILKIQYKDVAFWTEVSMQGTAVNRVNFQMWFYEAGSAVEFRFGTSNVPDPELAYEGLSGPPIWFVSGASQEDGAVDFGGQLTGEPSAPQLEGITNLFDFFEELFGNGNGGLNGTPADGQVYRLSNTIVSTTDLADQAFELFPTIAQQEVFLRGDLAPGTAYRMFNLNGSTVASGVLTAKRIDVSDLPAGMYLLQIDGAGSAQKFVKR